MLLRSARYGFDFANRFRWRLVLAVCFAGVVSAGSYALRVQMAITEASVASHDGTRVLVRDRYAGLNDIARVIDHNGRTIRTLGTSASIRDPVITRERILVWLEDLRGRKTAIRKLDLSHRNSIQSAIVDGKVLAALADETGRVVHAVEVVDTVAKQRHLVIRRGILERPWAHEDVERIELGFDETVGCEVHRNLAGDLQFLINVDRRYGAMNGKFLHTDSDNGIQLVWDPSSESVARLSGEENEWKTGSANHRVTKVPFKPTLTDRLRPWKKRRSYVFGVARRESPENVLFQTPFLPKWIAGDTFYVWDDDRETVLSIFEPGGKVRTVRLAGRSNVAPVANGQLLICTESGLLQVLDSKTGSLRTMRDVRAGWQVCAAIAAFGLLICVIAWLWFSWHQEIRPNMVSPLTDVLLLVMALTVGTSCWYEVSYGLQGWSAYFGVVTAVFTWTLLGTSALFAINCRSMWGRGSAFLLAILVVVLYLFKSNRVFAYNSESSVLINSGWLFVGLVAFGCLRVRKACGRFMMPLDTDEKTAEHQVSLRQIVILTVCFAALFSVMNFHGIRFTLDVEWKRLVPAVVLSTVVIISLRAALRVKNVLICFSIWFLASAIISQLYWWVETSYRLDTQTSLIGAEYLTYVRNWGGLMPPRSRFIGLVTGSLQFAIPSLLLVLVVRYCRSAGMRCEKTI